MTNDLRDKHIVVTGGSGALGGAVVERLLAEGATCHVPCREPEVPASLTLASHERVSATPDVDLTQESQVVTYFAGLPPLWGSIQLAGGFSMAKLAETSAAEVERMFRLNTLTCFLCCREAVAAVRRGGGGDGDGGAGGGRLVNVTARPVLRAAAGMVAYSASKAAVAAITQTLAEELRPEHILVNAVVPSIIDTPQNRRAMPKAQVDLWPKPSEIAETIAFLVAPGNALTSGALIPVYGRA